MRSWVRERAHVGRGGGRWWPRLGHVWKMTHKYPCFIKAVLKSSVKSSQWHGERHDIAAPVTSWPGPMERDRGRDVCGVQKMLHRGAQYEAGAAVPVAQCTDRRKRVCVGDTCGRLAWKSEVVTGSSVHERALLRMYTCIQMTWCRCDNTCSRTALSGHRQRQSADSRDTRAPFGGSGAKRVRLGREASTVGARSEYG